MGRIGWACARLAGGAAVLAVLVGQVGTGPFLQGLSAVSGWPLLWAALIALLTTSCSAWRWSVVSRGFGVGVPVGLATAAYYRSQFLNSVLPGGVLGDVHRALVQGRDVGNVSRSLRAVAWERSAGQVVQVAVTVVVLLALPSPVRSSVPAAVVLLAVCALWGALAFRALPHEGPRWWAPGPAHGGRRPPRRPARSRDLAGRGVRVPRRGRGACGHVHPGCPDGRRDRGDGAAAAAGAAGAARHDAADQHRRLGSAGGAAAWLFAAAGLGAGQGLAAATVYGVLVLVATLPGAAVLVVCSLRQRRQTVSGDDGWVVVAPAAVAPAAGSAPRE